MFTPLDSTDYEIRQTFHCLAGLGASSLEGVMHLGRA